MFAEKSILTQIQYSVCIMNLKLIMNLMFRELSVYYKGYKEKILPRPDGYIHEFSKNEQSVKIIFDQVNYKILNVSDNIESLTGHTVESLRNTNISSFLSFVVFDHILFLYVWIKWVNQIIGKAGNIKDVHLGSITTFCGIKIRHKDGHIMRLMIRQTGLEHLDNGAMKVSVISADDISHLIKSDSYWGRIAYGDERKYLHHLMSKDKKDMPHDIISDREKEVLRLIAKGMESKEIANELFISNHTVDNHRRNMISRTGARDTTALVQICRMAGII
jgi:DNA-binding CsgD family transcriptional regulator